MHITKLVCILFFLLYFLFSWGIKRLDSCIFYGDANYSNSLILLNQLEKVYGRDSVISWIDKEEHFNIVLKVDTMGHVLGLAQNKIMKRSIEESRTKLDSFIVKQKQTYYLPCDFNEYVSETENIKNCKNYYKNYFLNKKHILIFVHFLDSRLYLKIAEGKKQNKTMEEIITSLINE